MSYLSDDKLLNLIAALRKQLEAVDQIILALDQMAKARAQTERGGIIAKRRGRPPGAKNRSKFS